MQLAIIGAMVLATGSFVSAATPTSSGILAVASPTWLPDFPKPSNVLSGYPTGPLDTTSTLSHDSLDLTVYPEPWTSPSTTHAEVQAVFNAIDWDHVPAASTHKAKSNGDLDFAGYDENTDPYCWWSDTNCVDPKVTYLPSDISYCPNAGDWGLTYDDGPFNPTGNSAVDKYAEPNLYNFLATTNQKSTLFYIGSNVATFPAAAQRALNDGHVLCVHTWSHPQMTSQSNIQVVAELYWTLRAIKEATGITSRCWRPPYGDVDDRVRAIAWQMGLRTILWDEDTNDWDMPGEGGGNLAPSKVDSYFQGWIDARNSGKDNKRGHIVLEHELNNSTVSMTEKWLPKLQQVFNVVSVHACMNISQPYWEENWVYPTEANNITTSTPVSASSAASQSFSATPVLSLAPSAVSSASSSAADSSDKQSDSASSAEGLKSASTDSGASNLFVSGSITLVAIATALWLS
ncbi:chitin deacetylase [Phycomyces blakesleeanus]|uniref:Chitin deacetylase n=2 Tax=Phycomyces blakesleeanus TaxID=4837 RepID=A0A162V1P9_PHYB8|nr:chitin deacetylase [Phycomyces blakesleeanus NRRL 1555(-)]OAD79402.1 chitin deacetylase [Phycomyces blakesleeanus NRRL 1555(-)]BAB03595.1 chitin deacetylase [Phycomyces blakesleeanus]|eukprot:XP_018297442.1 chitin deacetylase [Phycomyces blakesleeanus NRRL 1555(-)]